MLSFFFSFFLLFVSLCIFFLKWRCLRVWDAVTQERLWWFIIRVLVYCLFDIYTVHIVLKFVTLQVEPPLHSPTIPSKAKVCQHFTNIITESRFVATWHSKILTLLSLFFLQKWLFQEFCGWESRILNDWCENWYLKAWCIQYSCTLLMWEICRDEKK
jgi:hypothetical protein